MCDPVLDTHWRRLNGTSLLAFHIFGCLVDNNEPIQSDYLVAMRKILSEACLLEVKEVLG